MATTQGYPARRQSAWSVTLLCWLVVGAVQFVELGKFEVITGLSFENAIFIVISEGIASSENASKATLQF
jgi:hypothetical protein